MFAANETVPKSGRVEQDALQDIQAGRSSTRWFGAGGGALWAAALHSMVRWEERRGTAGGSGPAVLEPSASTMSAPKGEGGGERAHGGSRGSRWAARGQFPPASPRGNATRAQTPPASPLPQGVELSFPLPAVAPGATTAGAKGGKGLRGVALRRCSCRLLSRPPALLLPPGSFFARRGSAASPACGRRLLPIRGLPGPRDASATVASPPPPVPLWERLTVAQHLWGLSRAAVHRDTPCTRPVGAAGVPGNATAPRCLLQCV